MFNKIQSILGQYEPVSLEQTESIRLMNRTDSKYIISIEKVYGFLLDLSDDYCVLEIESKRFGHYCSMYYDTDDLHMLNAHITKRYPRYKIRERVYSQNGLQFLEVKFKNANGRTKKKRMPLNENKVQEYSTNDFIDSGTPFKMNELRPKLYNYFDRITLVNKAKTERLTFDFNLRFESADGEETPIFKRAVVVELKQDKKIDSPIANCLRNDNIRRSGMSKYCIGMLFLNNQLSFKLYKPTFVKFLNLVQ